MKTVLMSPVTEKHSLLINECGKNEAGFTQAFINGEWYDLFWFNGAQTEYAEIIYTVNGEKSEVSKYDTIDMNLIYAKSPEKDYSIEVCYYDSDGNRYE